MAVEFEKEVRWFLGARGPLAKLLPRYESRPEQAEMAAATLRAFAKNQVLMVEAGTGTGKTLAYLAPALYSARKIVISTGTKALQEQLIKKDLPVLGREFNVSAQVMKGRSNYLCRRRYQEFHRAPEFEMRSEVTLWDKVVEWAGVTQAGDRAEIPGMPDYFSAWRELSANGEQCLGQKCESFGQCFVSRMRAQAQAADIVIVNHHLFFADLSLRSHQGQVLPDYQTVIFDEAHALPEIATEFFGPQVSTWRILDLTRDLRRLQRLGGLPVSELRPLLAALDRAEDAALTALKVIAERGPHGEGAESPRFALERVRSRSQVAEEGERASTELKLLAKELGSHAKEIELLENLADRATALADDLSFIINGKDPDFVYWAETRGRGVVLRASPAEPGPILADLLFSQNIPVIFTSATLAVKAQKKWSFAHFRSELGLEQSGRELAELCLPTCYEWDKRTILYVPTGLPDPTAADFITAAAREMLKILRLTRGRAFLLFTSYRNLEAAHQLLAPHLQHLVLRQGDAPKTEILERFRQDGHAVLFATQSFWEGVDVAGQALSCVIIDKLPFASPGDPLTSARIDRLRQKGQNPFRDFQLPVAVISLKQGIGRLMRTREDYGVLAILDGRLHSRQYGKTFIDSLPPSPLTTRLSDVKDFLDRFEPTPSAEDET